MSESVRERARDAEDWKDMLRKYSAALQAYTSADAGSEAERIADAESDRLEAEIVRVLADSSLARKQEREECAKVWCDVCRDEEYAKPELFQRFDYEQPMWWHRRIKNHHDNLKNIVYCTAAAIHARGCDSLKGRAE